jgi:hypothetical protein
MFEAVGDGAPNNAVSDGSISFLRSAANNDKPLTAHNNAQTVGDGAERSRASTALTRPMDKVLHH